MHPRVPHNELVRSFQRDASCFLDVCLFAQEISRHLAKSGIHRLPTSLFRASAKSLRLLSSSFSLAGWYASTGSERSLDAWRIDFRFSQTNEEDTTARERSSHPASVVNEACDRKIQQRYRFGSKQRSRMRVRARFRFRERRLSPFAASFKNWS